MTDQLNSQLSAFVDDALSAEERELLVRRLCRDPQLRDTMARYALIGDAARGGDVLAAPPEFSRRIMMGVEGQPMPTPRVAPVRSHPGRQIGFAVAASVALAAVALLSLPGRTPAPDATVQTVIASETGQAVTPVVSLADVPVPAQSTALSADDSSARLNSYLMQHVSATGPRQGAVAYRNVGYVTEPESRR